LIREVLAAGRVISLESVREIELTKVGALPSGEYFAYAIDFIEPGQESALELLERIQMLATRFSLGEGETTTVNLKLTVAP
jgi:hypothetical protein